MDGITRVGAPIIDLTKASHGVDIGPLWRFCFLGEGLDRSVGQGVSVGAILEDTDDGYNVIVLGNGLVLQDPSFHDATAAEIRTLHHLP